MTTAAATPGLDIERLTQWLPAHVDGLRAPLRFARIGDGQSNLTFLVEGGERSVVLRRPPLGETLESAHDMQRERRVLSALAGAGVTVPRPLASCEDAAVTGAPFFVMEHVEGQVLTSRAAAEALPEAGRRRAAFGLVDALVQLQAVDVDAAGLSDFRRERSYAARQLRRWQKQWDASRGDDAPGVVDAVGARLAAALPLTEDSVLVHGDYHFGNVLTGPAGELRALLDWELCTVGDPLADVGLMVVYYTELGHPAGRPDGVFREPVTTLPGFPTTGELVAAYAAATGRDVAPLQWWVAFGYWKVAIILQGVYARWRNNPANGSGASALGAAVERVAGLAAAAAG
ncbi:MAG TPA: phosphotransferase family protein [Solirubrobacteraceae bacterium]